MELFELQKDKVIAAADLVGRAGAVKFQIGYIESDLRGELPADDEQVALDDALASAVTWYAHAQYRGARIIAENHSSPGDAAEALARRLLTGARCSCGKLVALQAGGAIAYQRPVMADGSTFPITEAVKDGQCRWTRHGARWERECGD